MSKFTAKEVVEILNKAKELGVISIKLEGFEAAFDLTNKDTPASSPSGNGKETCETCGGEKIEGTYGLYCRPCYINRKEKNWQAKKTW